MKYVTNTLYTTLIATLLLVAGLFLATLLPLPGKVEVKIVKSGSMEPAIPTGSVVVIAPSSVYAVGDVITFGKDSVREVPTTHRIHEITDTGFITKGDANEEADVNPVFTRDVIGKVYVHVPYAGFVLDFARKPMGFALLIGLPALLIIIDELFTIIGEVGKLRRRRDHTKPVRQSTVMHDIRVVRATHKPSHYPARKLVMGLIATVGLIGGVGFGHIGSTVSYLGDIEHSVGNILGAGVWSLLADPQNIVLNEFLPNPDSSANGLNFGDDADDMPNGEWVELYNNGDVPIDVAGWRIEDASGGGGNTHAVVSDTNTNTGDTIVAPHGWLVVYMNKPTLNNTGDTLRLFTNTNSEVDSYTYDDPSDFCEKDPTPGNTNGNDPSGIGTPGNGPNADCPQNQVAPNKSYARIPDGVGAFVDPIPTPGSENIPEEGHFAPFTIKEENNADAPVVEEAPTVDETSPSVQEEEGAAEETSGPPTPDVLGVEIVEEEVAEEPVQEPPPTGELEEEPAPEPPQEETEAPTEVQGE